MKTNYLSQSMDSHIREEEKQWAKIIASGNQYAGLILIYDQKLCAVAHEMIDCQDIPNQANILKKRIQKVIDLLDDSGYYFKVKESFEKIISELEEKEISSEKFKKLIEQIHSTSHELCDELYNILI